MQLTKNQPLLNFLTGLGRLRRQVFIMIFYWPPVITGAFKSPSSQMMSQSRGLTKRIIEAATKEHSLSWYNNCTQMIDFKVFEHASSAEYKMNKIRRAKKGG